MIALIVISQLWFDSSWSAYRYNLLAQYASHELQRVKCRIFLIEFSSEKLCLQSFIDEFHIWHKWSQVQESVSRTIALKLDYICKVM